MSRGTAFLESLLRRRYAWHTTQQSVVVRHVCHEDVPPYTAAASSRVLRGGDSKFGAHKPKSIPTKCRIQKLVCIPVHAIFYRAPQAYLDQLRSCQLQTAILPLPGCPTPSGVKNLSFHPCMNLFFFVCRYLQHRKAQRKETVMT